MGVLTVARVRRDDDHGGHQVPLEVKDESIVWGSRAYRFDKLFAAPTTTAEVFADAFQGMVTSVVDGYDATVFAYGQTGSGKTHTIFGTDEEPGVARLAGARVFEMVAERPHLTFSMRVAMMEILDEKAVDLLHGRRGVVFRSKDEEGQKRGLGFHGLGEVPVTHAAGLARLLARGLTQRTTAANYRHDASSRSHVVLRIVVETMDEKDGGSVTCGAFSVVDLAGSESAMNNASATVAAQGITINRSLLFLRQAVKALGAGAMKKGERVSFRNSLITRLLEPALTGDARLAVVCTLPSGVPSGSAEGARQVVDALDFVAQTVTAVKFVREPERHVSATGAAGQESELARLRALLKELEGEREAANEQAGAYAALVEEQRARTMNAESLKAQADDQLTAERERAAEVESRLQEVEASARAREAAAASLEVELGAVRGQHAALREQLNSAEERLADAAASVADRQSALDALREQARAETERVGALEDAVGAREAQLAALDRRLAEKDAEARQLVERAMDVEKRFAAQATELENREAQLEDLRAAKATLERAVEEAEARAREAAARAVAASDEKVAREQALQERIKAKDQLLLLKHRMHVARRGRASSADGEGE